jgi:hypothetical protein
MATPNLAVIDGTGKARTIAAFDTTGSAGPLAYGVCIIDVTNTYVMPTMDAVARPGYFTMTDGTHTMPTGDAAARPIFVEVTNGTQSLPTGDAIGRSIFVAAGDGTNAFKAGTAANLSAESSVNAQMCTFPGNWAASSHPAVGTLASASQAAGGAGVRHVCSGFAFSWASDGTANGAAQQVTVVIRDGATGAGTILGQWPLSYTTTTPLDPPNRGFFALSGLNLVGSAATAMTAEFIGTASSHELYGAAVFGYDCV